MAIQIFFLQRLTADKGYAAASLTDVDVLMYD